MPLKELQGIAQEACCVFLFPLVIFSNNCMGSDSTIDSQDYFKR